MGENGKCYSLADNHILITFIANTEPCALVVHLLLARTGIHLIVIVVVQRTILKRGIELLRPRGACRKHTEADKGKQFLHNCI